MSSIDTMLTEISNGSTFNCNNTSSEDVISIAYNFAFNSVIWIVCLIIFSIIPKLIQNYRQNEASCISPSSNTLTDLSSVSELQLSCESTTAETSFPEHLRQTDQFTSWLRVFWRLTDKDITQKCGPDAIAYLRFQRYLIGYLFFILFLTLVIILPVNYTGGQFTPKDISSTTTINVHSNLLWLHVSVSLLYLLATIFLLLRLSQHLWTSNKSNTLLISNIPQVENSKNLIELHLNRAYPNITVKKIVNVYDTRKILELDQKLQKIRHLKEHYQNVVNAETYQESDIKENVESTCFRSNYINNLDETEETILSERAMESEQLKEKSLGIVFVKLASVEEAEYIYSSFHSFCKCKRPVIPSEFSDVLKVKKWRMSYAPRKEDIIWQNLPTSHFSKFIRKIIVAAILFFACLVVTSPALVTSLFEKINKTNSPFLDIIQSLLLKFMVNLLPMIVTASIAFLRSWTKSLKQKKTMIALFTTLLFAVLILPSLGLTTYDFLSKSVNIQSKMHCIFTMGNNYLFVNYVIVSALIGTGLELLRISELLTLLWRYLTIRSTVKRRTLREYDTIEFDFGEQYAWILCLFSVVVTYSILFPIISIFGCLYIILKYCVDRYNLYFIYRKSYVHKTVHLSATNIMVLTSILPQFCILEFTLLVTSDNHLPPHVFYYSLAVFVLSLTVSISIIVWFYFKQQQVIRFVNRLTNGCCCVSEPKLNSTKCDYGSISNS
ncbi:CSC1-like protein 2 [Octopus sinensis]|uniref:CSC1-like protein 2 n=1 Tax=Octopus sinensis TaxID=2607531 RepID=A0A6P7T305_9MOLL|nr:CSC1-like protein 2 [Octopus sinensis]